MEIFEIIVNFLLLIAAVILVIVVLAQESKSSGLGGAFGGETTALTTRGKKASREKQLQKLTVPAFKKWFTPAQTSAMIEAVRYIF